jgi:small subunit ribosomal protein S18
MGFGQTSERGERGERGDKREKGKKSFGRKKVCRFCADKTLTIEYKDYNALKYFITERGKIIPRRISGNCAGHQRELAVAVSRARMLALLPFTAAGM